MITVISGTNRIGNVSVKVANSVVELLTRMGEEVQLLDLQKLPRDFVFHNDVFGNADPGMSAISDQFVKNADKFVFVVPEYNGSIPGITKAFIDAIWPEQFQNKKAALIGLASGRAGNVRGLDHLTNILNYLHVAVLPHKINITHVDAHMSEEGHLKEQKTLQLIQKQMSSLVAF